MNDKLAAAAIVLACALGAAGCSHNNNENAGPATNASTQLPQTPPYSAATATQPAGTTPAAGMSNGAAAAGGTTGGPTTPFDVLAGSKGYVTQQDAQRDAWLGAHFNACDANHDGKLTRQEYAQCAQTHGGANTPEGVPAPASTAH
ncbi:MAG: hypothetical protein OJF61_001134 [Rhodanobacteraceae bacterium]|nr:MAG: hypothetical protein OJF61_001134 [Rhodanobacteraceae bacterium]